MKRGNNTNWGICSTENLEGVEKIEVTVHILIWKEGAAC